MSQATKVCRKCGQTKPHADFHSVKANRDGLRNACKPCWSDYYRSYYQANKGRVLAKHAEWRSRDPETLRALERQRMAAYRAADPDGVNARAQSWREQNRERCRLASRAFYSRNRERLRAEGRAYQRLWRQSNRHLAAIRDSNKRMQRQAHMATALVLPFTALQLSARMSMWPGCWMCGGPKEAIDHIKPIARGGAHCLANLRPACRSCNASKSDTWPYPTEGVRLGLSV